MQSFQFCRTYKTGQLAAEKIRSYLETLFVTAYDTRWNSVYDAVSAEQNEQNFNHAPLVINGFKAGIRRRSDDVNNNTDAQLAAVVHPQFNLYWLREEVQKARLVTTLKSHVSASMKEGNLVAKFQIKRGD